MKTYTVVEAASILIEEGIIRRNQLINKNGNGTSKFSTGEPQVRLWIREYNKVFQKEYNNQLADGEKQDDAANYAHTKASMYGIKAKMESRKIGYRIFEKDLKEFIEFKIGTNKETRLVDELRKYKLTKQKELKETQGPIEEEWFDKGFQSAIEYLERYFSLDQKLLKKNIIQLPEKGWFINPDSVKGKHYQLHESDHSFLLRIDFQNTQVEQLKFKMTIHKQKKDENSRKSTKIDWTLKGVAVSLHFRNEIEKIISNEDNIEVIKEILCTQIPEDEENKLLMLLLLLS